MKLDCHVRDISTISHMTYHNGQPCDLYTATVKLCRVGFTGAGLYSAYLVLYAKTEQKLEKMLDKYRTDALLHVPIDDLVDSRGFKYHV